MCFVTLFWVHYSDSKTCHCCLWHCDGYLWSAVMHSLIQLEKNLMHGIRNNTQLFTVRNILLTLIASAGTHSEICSKYVLCEGCWNFVLFSLIRNYNLTKFYSGVGVVIMHTIISDVFSCCSFNSPVILCVSV